MLHDDFFFQITLQEITIAPRKYFKLQDYLGTGEIMSDTSGLSELINETTSFISRIRSAYSGNIFYLGSRWWFHTIICFPPRKRDNRL